jgi:glycerophosphoryl diester phosphodiesterase
MSSLLCIAHRGGPIIDDLISPENSLQAIQRSLALGVDAIEIDVWQLHGELFVTHDRALGRQIAGAGLLQSKSLAELRQLTLANGEPLPRLYDVLNAIDDRAALNIEIKGANSADAVIKTLTGFVEDRQLSFEQYSVSSFDHRQLFEMLQKAPHIKRGVLIEGIPLDYAACCAALQAWSLNSHVGFLNQTLVNDARRRGLKNFIYTVNTEEDWQWMVELGVDGVFTDRPAELLQFNQRQATQ